MVVRVVYTIQWAHFIYILLFVGNNSPFSIQKNAFSALFTFHLSGVIIKIVLF